MAGHTLCLVEGCRIGGLCVLRRSSNIQKDHAEQEDYRNRYRCVLKLPHHASRSGDSALSGFVGATAMPGLFPRKIAQTRLQNRFSRELLLTHCEGFRTRFAAA
jgi:hypothetical protein